MELTYKKKCLAKYRNKLLKPVAVTTMGHVKAGKRARVSAFPRTSGSGMLGKWPQFPLDEDNPTPEEMEEVRLRTLEIQGKWSPAERKLREPYDPSAQDGRSYIRCYRLHETAERVEGFTFEGFVKYDDLSEETYDT